MRKLVFLTFILVLSAISSFAQTVNYALNNATGIGYIETSPIKELNNSPVATFQMWINPSEWTKGAKLFAQDNFSIELGDNQAFIIKSSAQSASFLSTSAVNQWMQMTITIDHGRVRAYINNTEQNVTGNLPDVFTVDTDNCILAKGFKGQMDEIRIWKVALEQKDFVWRNTLHKFNPYYELLISYWKGDQEQCENLVDYKFAHHGIFHDITRTEVEDNINFRYRIGVGYTNIMRFTDRWRINRDMFLMTNDVILLSARLQTDGTLFPELPDNSSIPTKVDYLAEFKGHKGVIDFKGEGSQMVSENGNIFFDPTTSDGHGATATATLSGWIYIDSWKEGAVLFSKYQNTDNCFEVKLGNEADKSIIVNLCGTVATLKGKLDVGKWQYIGVYLAPKEIELSSRLAYSIIQIGVDYELYSKLNEVELSGNDMQITTVPLMGTTPIVIGKDFAGKMDEIMVWGTDRKGSAKNDAENGYKWNVGNWSNIFLNAYWKGDDSRNIGKDYQSLPGLIEYMRGYYAGYRGFKIRVGIVSSQWKNVLNQKENLDRMLTDANKMLAFCDGIDVDLEWAENQAQYDIYNNVAHRLHDEVIAVYPTKKILTLSLHQYSHRIDKNLFKDIDYFTVQLYGPQTSTYTYDWYVSAYNQIINYGLPKEKMLLSYGNLLVNGSTEMGYISLFDVMGVNESNYDPYLNIWNYNNQSWYFNGINQVRRKQDFIIDNDACGTMYFDMGNDLQVSDPKSLIRAQNDIIASNVDTLITRVDMTPSSIIRTEKAVSQKGFSFYPNPAKEQIILLLNESLFNKSDVICGIYTTSGQLIKQFALSSATNILCLDGLTKGIYLIIIGTGTHSEVSKLQID